jgi:ABC-type sulfate transport system substrate-binding protein
MINRKARIVMIKRMADYLRSGHWRRLAAGLLGIGILVVVTVFGRAALANTRDPVRLVVYAFSTQEEVLTQGIFPAFEQAWEAETGRELTIEGLFGPSATMAGQINLGAPADVALFSNAQHVIHLKVGRRVRQDTQPVVIGLTPMVIVTRPGNPLGIHSFADLSRPGVRLLHADPRSSGAGQWAVLAEYGNALAESNSRSGAEGQLQAIWRNVRVLAPSARSAMTLFELGAGDALLTYEQDARLAQERGVPLEIVVPAQTIVAQHVAVVVDDNVRPAERPAAEAFIRYLQSESGQDLLARYHLRSPETGSDLLPALAQPFTVEDLGGWPRAYLELVDTLWQKEIEPHLDLEPTPQWRNSGGNGW